MTMLYIELDQAFLSMAWLEALSAWGLARPRFWATILGFCTLLAMIGTSLGFLGRISTFLLLFPLAFNITVNDLHIYNALALVCSCYLLLFGTGRFSLWQPRVNYLVLWI